MSTTAAEVSTSAELHAAVRNLSPVRLDYNAGCTTLVQLSRAGREPRCPFCGAPLKFFSQDRVEGADYLRCPRDREVFKWMWS